MAKPSGNGSSGGRGGQAGSITLNRATLVSIVIAIVGFLAVDRLDSYQFRGQVNADTKIMYDFLKSLAVRIDAQQKRHQDDMQALYRLRLEAAKGCQQQ